MAGCASAPAAVTSDPVEPQAVNKDVSHVLVVANQSSLDSMKIANYYVEKRKIPAANLVRINTSVDEQIWPDKYKAEIESKVKAEIMGSKTTIDYIVLTKGIPLRVGDIGGYSTDALLAGMDIDVAPIKQMVGKMGIDEDLKNLDRCISPFFNKNEKFSHAKFKMYLVTRLTGYTAEDAMKLVDQSLAAKPEKGPFLLDSQPLKPKEGGYGMMEKTLSQAADVLTMNGMKVQYDENPAFVASATPLMGYASWGSNDDKFSLESYHRLRFKPGAIAETFVSTSGRTFNRTTGGQSLIADLVEQGVTGVKGYVSEPYTFALAKSQILFDRYTRGFNLAESFYMATPMMKWKDIVVGDPLCCPYPPR